MENDKKLKYPKTKWFYVKDKLPEKHLYCITPKHLEYSEGMYLDIEGAEKKGAVCDICRKHQMETGATPMTHAEHKHIYLSVVKLIFRNIKKNFKNIYYQLKTNAKKKDI